MQALVVDLEVGGPDEERGGLARPGRDPLEHLHEGTRDDPAQLGPAQGFQVLPAIGEAARFSAAISPSFFSIRFLTAFFRSK